MTAILERFQMVEHQLVRRGISDRRVCEAFRSTPRESFLPVTKTGPTEFHEETMGDVRFVPLIGEQGWLDAAGQIRPIVTAKNRSTLPRLIRETAEPIADFGPGCVDALLERIGSARLVLLGEATHGTREFYRLRARITQELIERRGFETFISWGLGRITAP